MKKESALLYTRKSFVLLVVSISINGLGLAVLSYRINSIKNSITTNQQVEKVLSATTPETIESSVLTTELTAIKDELARLRAEQRDINRILELPTSPQEFLEMISNLEASTSAITEASTSATPTP